MNQYRFEFLNDNNAPMAKCRYQIMQNDSILYQDIADGNGRAAFNSELVAGKKIRVRFWAEGQRQDAAFSTEPFYWTENVITQPIKAPKVYEVKLRETQNKNNEPANYRQAFYEVQAGDTWEGIAKKCNTNASSIKFLNNLPDDSTLPEVGDALLLPQGAERPLDSGSPSDKEVIESHSNEPQNDSLKGLDEKTPGPEQDKPSILPQEVAPSVAENQPEHPSTIVENKKPEAKKKKDTIGDLLKELDEEKSKQKKDDQPILPQSAEPVGQGQTEQPVNTNLIADKGEKPTEKKDSEPNQEDSDIQKGRGRSGRPVTCVRKKIPLECQIEVIRFSTSKGEYVISKQLWDFILSAEGYEAQPYVPTGSSGVTLGYGYDLGQQKKDKMYQELSSYYTNDQLKRLEEAIGKRGNAARKIVGKFSDITITREKAKRLAILVKRRYAEDTVSIYPEILNYHPHCQGAILSLVYNRGNQLIDKPDHKPRGDMRDIQSALKQNRGNDIPKYLRAMKRLWSPKKERGLIIRREGEAEWFEKGLRCDCFK